MTFSIKPLAWGPHRVDADKGWSSSAKTALDTYVVSTASGEGCKGTHFWFVVGGTIKGWANSEDEAKAAAEADYTSRVMSCLMAKDDAVTAEPQAVTLAQSIVALIDQLRCEEGDQVTILCDNPDFNGQPNNAVVISAGWTNWQDFRVSGHTLEGALKNAVAIKALAPADRPVMPDAEPQAVEPVAWIDPETLARLHERQRWTTAILNSKRGEKTPMPLYAQPQPAAVPDGVDKRVRAYAHHALWGDLLDYKWSDETEQFVGSLVERIAASLSAPSPLSNEVGK